MALRYFSKWGPSTHSWAARWTMSVIIGKYGLGWKGVLNFLAQRWRSAAIHLPFCGSVPGGRLPVVCITPPRNMGRYLIVAPVRCAIAGRRRQAR